MAVKRTRKIESVTEITPVSADCCFGMGGKRKWIKLLGWIAIVLAGLVLYWYKTNTWPIVAMVGFKPITRYEVNQTLFERGGKTEIEGRITEMQVTMELKKLGITVTDEEIEAKVKEIEGRLGEGANIEELVLTNMGMDMNTYKNRVLRLQMGLEKALTDRVLVSDEEVVQYLDAMGGSATDPAQFSRAKDNVRLSKMDEEAQKWIKELGDKYKVWRLLGPVETAE